MRYAIDGSNVLLGLRLNKKPSTRLLARLVSALWERGDTLQLFFDDSVQRLMSNQGLDAEWSALRDSLSHAGITPRFASRADPHIAEFCKGKSDAAVINFNDKMDSWNDRPSRIHRVRAYRKDKAVHLVLRDDATGKPILSVPAHESFQFGGIRFPSLNVGETAADHVIARDSGYVASGLTEGVLLIFALDASGSMGTTNSFDERLKSTHLNEVITSAIPRLRNSRLGQSGGLYIAILRFSDEVTPLLCPATGTPFASVNDWFTTLEGFNYLRGVTMSQTNLRLALQRAKELIQDALADEEHTGDIAAAWHASVVLITDGRHEVQRSDGTWETDEDVGPQALEIHMGLPGLIDGRIDVGCVGIGADVNRPFLADLASACTPTQRRMATTAGVISLLRDNRLFMCVDSNDRGFGEAIRAFIDVASSRAS